MERPRILLIGYGNPGRLDDGLGPALAEAVERMGLPGVTVDADYQLTVEDAAAAAEHEHVIFADASVNGREPFFFRRVEPAPEGGLGSHTVEPGAVLALAQDAFGARTQGWALGIRGYAFDEFGERLSEPALRNLAAAAAFVEPLLRAGAGFERAVTDGPEDTAKD